MRITPLGRFATSLGLIIGIASTAASAQNSSQQPELPDSPSAVITQRVVEARLLQGQSSATASSSQPSQVQPQSSPQPSQSSLQSSTAQKPVGTAAAEAPNTIGVAASNPAGAAIAPAKQRRVRTLFIKVGAIVGAGVAVGAVAALSSASPSKPPGSH
jgi:hypothetical protein